MSEGSKHEQIAARLRNWQQRLLDLSFRNRLLNAREGRFLVRCEESAPADLEDVLANGGQVALVGNDEPRSSRLRTLALAKSGDQARQQCVTLYRQDRSRYEESGIQTMYLGLGLIEYREARSDTARPRRAPVILHPVEMTRETATTGFRLKARDERAEVNTTLVEWLRVEHHIDIGWDDGLPGDDAGIDVDAILDEVATRLDGQTQFTLQPWVVLGLFEFQKLGMWLDLERLIDDGKLTDGALGEIIGVEGDAPLGGSFVPAERLDEVYPPEDLPTPLAADSHQLAAVAAAKTGKSFVLDGPPGTGKSQTIANIIATAVADGRTVLFCAEKRAALDAVAERLKDKALDTWCLDLHAHRASAGVAMKQVSDSLERAYESKPRSTAQGQRLAARVEQTRDRLNRYAEALHRQRDYGRSVFDAISWSGDEKDRIATALPETPADEPQGIEGRVDIVRQLAGLARECGKRSESRFRKVTSIRGPEIEQHLRELARAALEADDEWAKAAAARRATVASGFSTLWPRVVAWRAQSRARRKRQNRLVDFVRLADASPAATGNAVWDEWREVLSAAAGLGGDLRTWLLYSALRNEHPRLGAAMAAVDDVPDGDVEALVQRVRCGWWAAWARRWMDDDEELRRFVGVQHDAFVQDFREAEERWEESAARWVTGVCDARVSLPDMQSRSRAETAGRQEVRTIQRESRKSRRIMPVRKLLDQCRDTVRQVKPCFLMSPLSVAQYLPEDTKFDLLVMDESSQIRPWDAFGVMARASQVILAGDDKQMPPTSFFDRTEDEDSDSDEDEEDAAALESVLDMALARAMPRQRLRFHYRSRHEDLIAFSNNRYYDGELVTFPDCRGGRHVTLVDPKGVYQGQQNVIEAKAVAEHVCQHVRDPELDDLSIGVVTFNVKQQRLIEDLLDRARAEDEGLESRWESDRRPAPCVRNLETAQGDERDVILLSITYARDPSGRQRSNFGPINREGGHRRLNVAVTRSRHRMVVFSSLDPAHIRIDTVTKRGVRDLKAFLEYAASGIDALTLEAAPGGGGYESPLEEEIAAELEARGWQVDPQVGVSGYRIDLGVVHPQASGRYLAAIEADGRQFHSASTARERDRLRQRVLEAKGWTVLRVWSPDWWRDRERCASRLDDDLRGLLGKAA